MANAPNLHVFWTAGGNPEHPEETHADTGRMCKLHTDSYPSWELWCLKLSRKRGCEYKLLITNKQGASTLVSG